MHADQPLGRDTPGIRALTDGVKLPPLSTLLAYTLPELRERRPPLFEAFTDALQEAGRLVTTASEDVVKLLNEAEELDLSPPTLARYITRPGTAYGLRIDGLADLGRFLVLTGQIKDPPPAWGDLTFEGAEGS